MEYYILCYSISLWQNYNSSIVYRDIEKTLEQFFNFFFYRSENREVEFYNQGRKHYLLKGLKYGMVFQYSFLPWKKIMYRCISYRPENWPCKLKFHSFSYLNIFSNSRKSWWDVGSKSKIYSRNRIANISRYYVAVS